MRVSPQPALSSGIVGWVGVYSHLIYIYIYLYMKERKFLKDVQQDGTNANTPQPGIELGTPADAAGALPTDLPGPGRKSNQNE